MKGKEKKKKKKKKKKVRESIGTGEEAADSPERRISMSACTLCVYLTPSGAAENPQKHT